MYAIERRLYDALQGCSVPFVAIPNGPDDGGFLVKIVSCYEANRRTGRLESIPAFEYSIDGSEKRYAHWLQAETLEQAVSYIKSFAA